jgi:hypothetical protein
MATRAPKQRTLSAAITYRQSASSDESNTRFRIHARLLPNIHVEAVAAEYFSELASRLRVCAGLTEKYVTLVKDLSRHRAHGA